MASHPIQCWTTKKDFYYDFFLKEALVAREGDGVDRNRYRELVEIREIYPPPAIDPNNPWQIKKILGPFEVKGKMILLSHNDLFDHVLRYWTLPMSKLLIMDRRKVGVKLTDLTEEKNPRQYEEDDAFLQSKPSDDCFLMCAKLIEDRELKVGDNIFLYWDLRDNCFRFKFSRDIFL